MKLHCTVLALLVSTSLVRAEVISFPEHNFSIDVPAGWTQITPRPPQALAALQNPENTSRILAFATKLPSNERATGAADVRAGAKESLSGLGFKIGPEQQLTISGRPFISFTADHPGGQTLTAFTTAAGDEVYMLSIGGVGADDPEFQSIIQSFRLLSPVEPSPLNAPSKSAAYRAGEKFGRALIFGAIPCALLVVGVVIWLVFRPRSKQNIS